MIPPGRPCAFSAEVLRPDALPYFLAPFSRSSLSWFVPDQHPNRHPPDALRVAACHIGKSSVGQEVDGEQTQTIDAAYNADISPT